MQTSLLSNLFLFASNLNFFKRIKLPLPATWTNFTRCLPSPLRFQIAIPKRPCATLDRPSLVYRTPASLWLEKYTIPIGILDQAFLDAHSPHEFSLERIDFHFHHLGHRVDFCLIDPHVPLGTTATCPALRAFKCQAISIPLFLSQFFFLQILLAFQCVPQFRTLIASNQPAKDSQPPFQAPQRPEDPVHDQN